MLRPPSTRALAAVALAVALPAVPAAAATTGVRPGRTPQFGAHLVACQRSDVADQRLLKVEGFVRAMRGSKRLGMRFDLYAGPPGGPPRRVSAPGLSEWRLSDPGFGALRVRKTVDNLAATRTVYRMAVSFRWYDATGRVMLQRTMLTRRCVQRDTRPDLVVSRASARRIPARPGLARYGAVVRNAGTGRVPGGVEVSLYFGAQLVRTRVLPALRPGGRVSVSFVAKVCSGSAQLVADPLGALAERDEANNSATVACPAA